MIILKKQTITGVAVSSSFTSLAQSTPSWIMVRNISGSVSFKVEMQDPEDATIWTALTDNDTALKSFAPANDCSIEMSIPHSVVKLRISQTAGTSASYQVLQ